MLPRKKNQTFHQVEWAFFLSGGINLQCFTCTQLISKCK